eukprot:jgi/Hompol1/193/HPOL_005256-RA
MSTVLYDDDFAQLTAPQIIDAFAGDPRLKRLPASQVIGKGICEVAAASEATKSRSAARKLINSGGLYLNKSRVQHESVTVTQQDLIDGKLCLLRTGKAQYTVLVVE